MTRKDKRVLRIHFGLAVAEILCVSGFAFELYRARSGNTLSWAYVFEWPLFGAYAIYMWHRFIGDETRGDASLKRGLPEAPTEEPDPALAAYNEFLRQVHDADDTSVATPPRTLNH